MFVKDKPAHLDQTDVGRLAETLKRRPTYQQLVSKKILRGDAVFGVSLENLIDIPDGIRMMADVLADSGSLDLLDVSGVERDMVILQNAIDAGNHSIEMMQLLPYAVGTLFMRFLQQLPEKPFSQMFSSKFLWVQEAEIATLRYTMLRSLIFLLVVSHRNMVAFLFKWLRKMSDDTRKSAYYTPAYLGNIFGHLLVHSTDTARAANTTQKLIEDYKHVFLDAEPDIRHFMKDGKQLVKWATVDRLIEKVIDPNCYDEQLAPMFFFCHMYFIEAKDLLEKMIGIYLKCKLGTSTWRSEICKRITNTLKLWVDNHGPTLSNNEPFFLLMADFMKRRRDSADPDASEKDIDKILYQHRTQHLIRTLPRLPNSGNGSGGKVKQLSIPSTILENLPAQPDMSALQSASSPTSPRNLFDAPRALVQTPSTHLSRTPPSPLNLAYLNGGTTVGSPKPAKPANPGKTPSTPIPTTQPQPVPSLARPNRYTRGAIPFPAETSPPFRTGSPSRPRAISNAAAFRSDSNHSSPLSSPRNSPPITSHNILVHSSSPPPPAAKHATTVLSPGSTRGRSYSKATAPEIITPEELNRTPHGSLDERRTFRYTATYGTLKIGNPNPRVTQPPGSYSIPFSPTSSSIPAYPQYQTATPISPTSSPTLLFPISPTASTAPTSPSFPISPTSPLPFAPFSPNTVSFADDTSLSDYSSLSDADVSPNSIHPGFQIPKSFSVDSHLSNAEGPSKRNRAQSVVAHGRSASAQLPLSGPSAHTELIEIDPKVIAEHMTIIDHEALKAIPINMTPKTSPNFNSMAQKLNEWGSWAMTEILRHQELYDRVNALSLFIEISKENLACNNFNSCCAILGALNNPAIQRLKNTWERVNKKTMSKFRKMMELFDFTYNSKNYREALKITKPPAVPYLGLIPKDITSVEEIPTFVENGMCNIDKMRTLYKILCEVQTFQKEQYNFKIFPEFMLRLKTLKDLHTDEEAYQRSLKIEPKETMTA